MRRGNLTAARPAPYGPRMSDPSFRPQGALRVDLGKGELSGGARRVVAMPVDTLRALARAVEGTSESAVALYSAGREWGESVASEVADEIAGMTGRAARESSPAAVLDQLSGRLASLGWGTVALELWGEGLAFVVRNGPGDGASRHLLSGFFAGFAGGIGGGSFAGAAIGGTTDLRVLVGNPDAIKAARRWDEAGIGMGGIVDRLRAGEHRRGA